MSFTGRLPSSPFKRHFEVTLGKMLQPEAKSPEDISVPYLRAANIDWPGVRFDDIKEMWFSPSEIEKYTLKDGDLVVLEGGDVGRATIVHGVVGILGFQNSVHRVRARIGNDVKFGYFWLQHLKSAGYFDLVCSKATLSHFTAEKFAETPFPRTDLPTQKRIAAFLDRETARIDELITKKERLVAVLREGLLSELERLVTPETPVHDQMIPFRWVCRIVEGQVDPTDPEWADKPLIAPNHIESRTGRLIAIETARDQGAISGKYAFPTGTVLYSKIRPNLAKACVSSVEGMCSADMYPVLPDQRLRPQFLLMQLLSEKFTDWATLESMRVAMPKINRETLGSYRLWVPDLDIQDAAVKRFFAAQAKNETLSDKVIQSIDRLREYRAALITAAVTGQIDVETYGKSGATSATLDQIE